MTSTPTTALSADQTARAEALERARRVLQMSHGFASTYPGIPEDLVAVARFILTGEDPYELEEIAEEDEEAAPAFHEGQRVRVLPGARANGALAAVPDPGEVVTVLDPEPDEDGDIKVQQDTSILQSWVLPQYLRPEPAPTVLR
jgi:hypothetical protein